LPNSIHAALVARGAGIPERWGYDTSWRTRLLTRAIPPPSHVHQAEYYQQLVRALGFPSGETVPHLPVPADAREAAKNLLTTAGWDGAVRLAAIAPGAAYGGAKRWPPESFAELIDACAADGVRSVLIGSRADEAAGAEVLSGVTRRDAVFNLIGRTDLATLAGVLSQCRALVTNDSGAMHLGAAVGVSVTALFGPTNERETRPLGGADRIVLTNHVWCRPCMLRHCPIDHRCMRGIRPEMVIAATERYLS